MKTCPKCGELNGENSSSCYKCHAPLLLDTSYRKICPKCRTIYSGKAQSCETCGGSLSVYSDAYKAEKSDNGGCWLYLVSILVPIAGIILGAVYLSRHEDELGKSLIATSVVTWIVVFIIGILFSSCRMF